MAARPKSSHCAIKSANFPGALFTDGDGDDLADIDRVAMDRANGLQGMLRIEERQSDVPAIGTKTTQGAAFDANRVEHTSGSGFLDKNFFGLDKVRPRVIQGSVPRRAAGVLQLEIKPIQEFRERAFQFISL